MNSNRIEECSLLAKDILKNFELNEIPLIQIVYKGMRLCRLLGDDEGFLLFQYESTTYPRNSEGNLDNSVFEIARKAGRVFFDDNKEFAKTASISELEESLKSMNVRLASASDPDISISSANPHQTIFTPMGNIIERNNIVVQIAEKAAILQTIKGSLYKYILQIYNKLEYGNIVEDLFTKNRLSVNERLSKVCPEAISKFVSVYENMDSSNKEDWANAVHSCRRILQDLADNLYPPQENPIVINGKTIQLGKEQYINRLIQFIASKKESTTYGKVVGADLSSIGNRIDAIYEATNKGTHSELSKEDASRFIIHTYFLLSDIISLVDDKKDSK